jgi:hypothetical protein
MSDVFHLPGRNENIEIPQESWPLGLDYTPNYLEYEAELLIIQLLNRPTDIF